MPERRMLPRAMYSSMMYYILTQRGKCFSALYGSANSGTGQHRQQRQTVCRFNGLLLTEDAFLQARGGDSKN